MAVTTRVLLVGLLGLLLISSTAAAVVLLTGREGRPGMVGSRPPAGETLPAFKLVDHRGKVVSSRALAGKAVLVTFLDSQCQDTCPILVAQISRGLRLLNHDEVGQVAALAISTDPRDTPFGVARFLRDQQAVSQLRYLLGSEQELRPVWQAFHILSSFDSGDHELHSAPVRLFDRDGVWRSTLHAGADLTPENLAHDLHALLT